MKDDDRQAALKLIAQQRALLTAVAEGDRDPHEADQEYKQRHAQLRAVLAKDTFACFCPWSSVMQWAYGGFEDWSGELDRLAAPLDVLLHTERGVAWRLVLYRRAGDANDLPFEDEFEASLSDEKWTVLDVSLRNELAGRGTELLTNREKCHPMTCGGGRRPQPTVDMYKIREKAPSGRVVLRVFFETAPGRTIVLLHGYDKGRDDSDSRQRAEAKVACRRRDDLLRQLADPSTAALALETERT